MFGETRRSFSEWAQREAVWHRQHQVKVQEISFSKGTKCPISPGDACLLRLVSLCPNLLFSLSTSARCGRKPIYSHCLFPWSSNHFLLQLFLFAKYRELLVEEGGIGHISKYPVVKIGAQGKKDHVSVVCPSYKWRIHLNCGFENKIRREWQLKLQRTVYPAAVWLREKQITGRPAVEQKVILTFLILFTSLSAKAGCIAEQAIAESSQNDQTVTSFSAFCEGDNELQVLCGISCASYTKSLSGLALKCQNQDNVALGWHGTLGCVEIGGDGWEFSCQNCYRLYIEKMPGCQESAGWKMSDVWGKWLKPQPVY